MGAIAAVIGAIASGGSALSLGGKMLATALFQAVSVGFAVASSLKKPDLPKLSDRLNGRKEMVRDPVAARRIVYGEQRVSGPVTFMTTTGANNRYLHLIIVLAGHEVEGIDDVYFNDEALDLTLQAADANGIQRHYAITEGDKYDGLVRIKKHLGGSGQAADADLVDESADWTADMAGNGIAYLYVRLKYDQSVFRDGIPTISAVVRGKNDIRDPRSDTGYSDNPALCLANYITDSALGLGAAWTEIDEAELTAAANVCDEGVALDGGGSESRYVCAGTLESAQPPREHIADLLGAMGGRVYLAGGKWVVRAGAYDTPTVEVGEDDLRGPVEIVTKASARERANAVKGVYTEPDRDWNATDFPAVKNSTYIAEDGGETKWLDLELPMTTSHTAAQRLSKIALEQARRELVVKLPLKISGLKLVAGGTFSLTLGRYGWDAKVFLVEDFEFSIYDEGDGKALGVVVTARAHDGDIYAWTAATDEQALEEVSDPNLPTVDEVETPTNLTVVNDSGFFVDDGAGGRLTKVTVSWDQPGSPFTDRVEIHYRETGAAGWKLAGTVGPEAYELDIFALDETTDYDFRVRFVAQGGAPSEWVEETAHTTGTYGGGQVATPEASPVGGTYPAADYPKSVTLSCATSGATIRYTLDGTMPDSDTDGTLYSGAFDVAANEVLRFRAFKSGLTESDGVVEYYFAS